MTHMILQTFVRLTLQRTDLYRPIAQYYFEFFDVVCQTGNTLPMNVYFDFPGLDLAYTCDSSMSSEALGSSEVIVDGVSTNCTGVYRSCTEAQQDPWFAVDLGTERSVGYVNIINDATGHGILWFGKSSALHCIALRCIALHCIALHCIALHCIALHCIALHCIAVQCSAVQCRAVSAVQCSATCSAVPYMQCNAVQCRAVQCCAALCCAVL